MGTAVAATPILRGLRYLGGHPAARRGLDHVDVAFDPAGVHFSRRHELLGSIAWAHVVDLAADAETTTSRLTVPRVWLLGVYAVLVPKRNRRVLLRVQDRRGAWLFTVDGIELDELGGGLRSVRATYAS